MSIRFMGLFLGLAAAVAMAAPAQAATVTIGFDADGGGGSIDTNIVDSLDLAPGNALANDVVFGDSVEVGDTFDLLYQAKFSAGRLDGSTIFSEADFDGEITIVARFPEVITAAFSGGGFSAAAFELGADGENYIRMYYDAAGNADDLAGTGFDDGVLILEGSVIASDGSFTSNFNNQQLFDQFNNDDYSGFQTVTGSGGSLIEALVESFDSNFFTSGIGALNTITLALFQGSNNTPFQQVDPSQEFAFAGVTPDLGDINGLTGPDFQFQADSAISFEVVPEPASLAVFLGLGAAGIGGSLRRRRKA